MSVRVNTKDRIYKGKRPVGVNGDLYRGVIQVASGHRYHALFTWEQLVEAIDRARRNPTLVPRLSWTERVKKWLFG